MTTWVLILVLCSGMSGGAANCEDKVIEHGLTEDECHTLALKLSAHRARPTMECVREDHDAIEDDEMEQHRFPGGKRRADNI